jgi:serine/threonine protein kinase
MSRVREIPGTNYVIARELGEGGHATVYLCHHKVLPNRTAAIKLLQHTFAGPHDKSELAARMRAEAQILAQLHHRNLVKVEDAGITTGDPPTPYIVMEYLRGEPLSNTLAKSPQGLPVAKVLDICLQLVAGLAEAHKLGVVHRDIKPANIFLSRQPDDTNLVKLLDFGVACLLAAKRTTGQLFLGTPKYASPEQCAGQPVTPQSDLYSIGLVAYELVCGRGPFSRLAPADFHAHFRCHLSAVPPPPTTFRRDCPPDLEELILQLLEKHPARRPATAPRLHDALNAILRRLETSSAASVSLLDRTEPDHLNGQMIPYSRANTPTSPLPLPAVVPHDTKPDLPMGNRITVRMSPAAPSDPRPLVAHLPPSEPSQPPTWHPAMPKRTVRMPSAPPRPSMAATPSAQGATLPGPPPDHSPSTPPTRPGHSDKPAPPHVDRASLVGLDAELEAVIPPLHTAHSSAPTASGLALPALRRAAHNRTWQLAAATSALLLGATFALLSTRQPRFTPAPPPAWLTADTPEPAPTPAATFSDASPPPAAAATSSTAPPDSADPAPPPSETPAAATLAPRPRPSAATPPRRDPTRGFKTTFH